MTARDVAEPSPAPAAQDALRELYECEGPRVLRFLTRLVGDASTAEDALHETFLRVQVDKLDPTRSPRGYLLRIARNVGIAALRKRAVRVAAPGKMGASALPTREPDPLHASAKSELRARVQAALSSLPPAQRSALLLRHDQGLSMLALGEALGVSERTARTRLREATVSMARALGTQGPFTEEDA